LLSDAIVQALKRQLPPAAWTDDPARLAPHQVEWRKRWHGAAQMMAMPGTVDEAATVVRLCADHGVPLVPQGGNTGLVGGQIAGSGELLISLKRMTRIRHVDPDGALLIAEAGVTLAEVQAAAAQTGLQFPLSLASEGSCCIGGVLASNAGGVHVLRYGMARDLTLGLEAVLAPGRIWNGLATVRKDNSGYDLRHLLIGSEGTLGLITAASLKLCPATPHRAVALAALADLDAAVALLRRARSHPALNAFEVMQRFGLDLVAEQTGAAAPFQARPPWLALIELAAALPLGEALETILAEALDAGEIRDAVIAQSDQQAQDLWAWRERLSEAQGIAGLSFKHDIALPVVAIPGFVARMLPDLEARIPGLRPCLFGHLGDGNLHFNLSQPVAMDPQAFEAERQPIAELIHQAVLAEGGSIAAEHGLGVHKAEIYAATADPVRLEAERAIRRALDPNGLFNPGRKIR